MTIKTLKTTIKHIYQRINGCTIEYDLSYCYTILNNIKNLERTLKNKTDHQLQQMSESLKSKTKNDGLTDHQVIESFALVYEAAWRVLKLHPFDVQLLGALAMQQGKLVEMQTGEGKTLTAVFPAYLSALTGKGVHVLTFNDYLARRDAQWMGPIYQYLGFRVGYIQ